MLLQAKRFQLEPGRGKGNESRHVIKTTGSAGQTRGAELGGTTPNAEPETSPRGAAQGEQKVE